jgi:hypothetical protein
MGFMLRYAAPVMLSFVLCACKPAQEGQLQPGELREEFAGWKILFYSEGLEPGKTRRAARIVARRA